MIRSPITLITTFALAVSAAAGGLPQRTTEMGPDIRQRALTQDLAFFANRLGHLPPGSGTPISVDSDRFDSEPMAAMTNAADRAWATAVARAAASIKASGGPEFPPLVSQSFQGQFAISITGRGRVVGSEPGGVLAVLSGILARGGVVEPGSIKGVQ